MSDNIKTQKVLTLIFLHYWPGSGKEWNEVKSLLEPYFNCLMPDLGGFGDALSPVEGFRMEAYADEVEKLIAENQIERYALVGHSMGGKIALVLAGRKPVGLCGVALLSTSPPTGEPMTPEQRADSFKSYGDERAIEKTFYHITARPLSDQIKQQVIADNLHSRHDAYNGWLETGSKENIAAQIAGIDVPLILVVGTADKVLPPAVHREHTLPYLPGTTPLHLIEGSGHLIPYEVPAEAANLLLVWAEKLSL